MPTKALLSRRSARLCRKKGSDCSTGATTLPGFKSVWTRWRNGIRKWPYPTCLRNTSCRQLLNGCRSTERKSADNGSRAEKDKSTRCFMGSHPLRHAARGRPTRPIAHHRAFRQQNPCGLPQSRRSTGAERTPAGMLRDAPHALCRRRKTHRAYGTPVAWIQASAADPGHGQLLEQCLF